jgi:hypothetical protein
MYVEEGWLDPWRGGEEACSSHHGVGGEGRGRSGREEAS